ncbi:MAG: hypothetical protein AAB217_15525 [Chloroflexota bacterium]
MLQTVTIHLPEETTQRYQRGAKAAKKALEEFLVERLTEAAPPLADDLPSPLREELEAIEKLDNDALRQIANSKLLPARQRLYTRLLRKNSTGTITAKEKETLRAIGDEARRLMLKKAHAFMLLKWRGQPIPAAQELQKLE